MLEVRLGGVKVAVWRKESEKSNHYNTTVSRIYKEGDFGKTSESFGRDDLLLLAKAADHAHFLVCEQSIRRQDREV